MRKMLFCTAILAIGAGIISVSIGIWGVFFTYQNVARENIITPSDASIPNTQVLGPFTLKSQADIIREHTLRATDGKTYAEMTRDENTGIWITATTLITALNLAIVTYAFSALIIFLGLISLWTGITYFALSRKF